MPHALACLCSGSPCPQVVMARDEESPGMDPVPDTAFLPQGEGAALALVRITEPQHPRVGGALRDHLVQAHYTDWEGICPKSHNPFSGRAEIGTQVF